MPPSSRPWPRASGCAVRVVRVDVARGGGRSPEEAARIARHAALARVARAGRARAASRSATPPTIRPRRSSCASCKGAGPRGLAGIPVRRGRIVRPLLAVDRAAVRAHLAAHGLESVEDATNRDTTVLPEPRAPRAPAAPRRASGRARGGGAPPRGARLAGSSGGARRARPAATRRTPHANAGGLAARARRVRRSPAGGGEGRDPPRARRGRGGGPSRERTPGGAPRRAGGAADRRHGGAGAPAAGVVVERGPGRALGAPAGAAPGADVACGPRARPGGRRGRRHGRRRGAPIGPPGPTRRGRPGSTPTPWGSAGAVGSSAGTLLIRPRRAGERMVPFGGDQPVRLTKLLGAAGVPRQARARWPVVAREGEVLWLLGVRRGGVAPLTAATRTVLCLRAAPESPPGPHGRRRRMIRPRCPPGAAGRSNPPIRRRRGSRARSRRAPRPTDADLQPAAPVPSRADPRPVVLVIDDEPGVRASVKMVLDGVCEVLEAPDGPAGIETVRSGDVDVCLLDVRLPGMEGIEVLERLKRLDPGLEVVLVTAVRTVRTAVEAMKLGAYDYLTKPFADGRPPERRQSRARAPGAPPRGAVSPGRAGAPRGLRSAGGAVSGDAPRIRARAPDRRHHGHRADHRRVRHRQGADRARDPPSGHSPGPSLRRRELRGPAGRAPGVGAVRPRAGRLHRRARAEAGEVRGGAHRHAPPGRDRDRSGSTSSRRSCERSRSARSSGWGVAARSGSTSASSPPATRTCARRWRPAGSGRTCSTASTWCRLPCRPSASGGRTWRRWPGTSSRSTRASSGSR